MEVICVEKKLPNAKKVYCDTMLVNTGSGARLKNAARPRDVIANWWVLVLLGRVNPWVGQGGLTSTH